MRIIKMIARIASVAAAIAAALSVLAERWPAENDVEKNDKSDGIEKES